MSPLPPLSENGKGPDARPCVCECVTPSKRVVDLVVLFVLHIQRYATVGYRNVRGSVEDQRAEVTTVAVVFAVRVAVSQILLRLTAQTVVYYSTSTGQ